MLGTKSLVINEHIETLRLMMIAQAAPIRFAQRTDKGYLRSNAFLFKPNVSMYLKPWTKATIQILDSSQELPRKPVHPFIQSNNVNTVSNISARTKKNQQD